ncbi:MAG: sulfatase-like hydrolase/transferase [Pseudomonadota bacterium]
MTNSTGMVKHWNWMTDKPPNILWYCADQMRYDTIAALGNSEINTPNLDRLIRKGMAFTKAYAQCQVCTPSRASFLTGRYPASTRVYRNGSAAFPAGEVLVTKLLADAGYDCGLIGKLHLSTATAGETRIDDGYRFFQWSHNPMTGEADAQNAYHHWLRQEKNSDPDKLFDSQRGFVAPGVPEELHQTTWCTEMALRFLEEKREKPWLLSINPYDPHPPFDPPADYLNRYDPEQLTPPLFKESDLLRQEQFKTVRAQTVEAVDPCAGSSETVEYESQSARGFRPPDSYDGRQAKAAYYAMIELIDHQFGRIVDALEATGEIDNTIVIFMSDHGELLGDHGLMYKGCRFFEGLVHVPLIIAGPEDIISDTKSDALVELVDVAPTLLDLAGLEIPERMQGKSLAPILRGTSPPEFHKSTVICDFNDSVGYSPVPNYTQASMTFDGRYKLAIYHSHDIGELFDLETDPGEFENLFYDPEHAELRDRLILRHLNRFAGTIDAGIERVSNA